MMSKEEYKEFNELVDRKIDSLIHKIRVTQRLQGTTLVTELRLHDETISTTYTSLRGIVEVSQRE